MKTELIMLIVQKYKTTDWLSNKEDLIKGHHGIRNLLKSNLILFFTTHITAYYTFTRCKYSSLTVLSNYTISTLHLQRF